MKQHAIDFELAIGNARPVHRPNRHSVSVLRHSGIDQDVQIFGMNADSGVYFHAEGYQLV